MWFLRRLCSLCVGLSLGLPLVWGQFLIIQELDTGFCSVDGRIESNNAGFTGPGFASSENVAGTSVSWRFAIGQADSVRFFWRFANRGGTGDRDAQVWIDGQRVDSSFSFPYTGSWTTWWETDTLAILLDSGAHTVRLIANNSNGLANLDYLAVAGPGVEAAYCPPSYYLRAMPNFADRGQVAVVDPEAYYDSGTVVMVEARAAAGYFFHNWSGESASLVDTFAFPIEANTELTANFFPQGFAPDPELMGYATVQDEQGTPYWVSGGEGGQVVTANSFGTLQAYLHADEPYIIQVAGFINGNNRRIDVRANKTLIGVSDSAHLYGIELAITNGAKNIIIRDLKLSHSVGADVIGISGQARHVWIHRCELFSDRSYDKDYFDGLLDIKNEASFITVSWSALHDHHKTLLMASNDESFRDSVARITLHHNYFYNNGSRLPLIRFGKAHIFNNYYHLNDNCINPRMNACVRVERNYFEASGRATFMDWSAVPGAVELIDNVFERTQHVSQPSCALAVPYDYAAFLDSVADVPALILAAWSNLTSLISDEPRVAFGGSTWLPQQQALQLWLDLDQPTTVVVEVFDLQGRKLGQSTQALPDGRQSLTLPLGPVAAGLLWGRITTAKGVQPFKTSIP